MEGLDDGRTVLVAGLGRLLSVDALVDFLRALNGEGVMDRAPTAFPK
jgi:hypothetical protein